jgi:ribosomal protein S18 acetylase RimI-like enzyme
MPRRVRRPPAHLTSFVEATTCVRRARPADAGAIAHVLTESLGDKLRPAYGRRMEQVLEALARHDLTRPGERHFVAEIGGVVVGAVHLALSQEPDPGFSERVAAEIGWLGTLRALVVLSTIAHSRLAPDEAYVEELGVLPSARRRGVGAALLAACEDEARRHARRRMTLWVTSDNRAAISLYERNGFRMRRRRRSLGARLLMGIPGTLLMEKALRSSTSGGR